MNWPGAEGWSAVISAIGVLLSGIALMLLVLDRSARIRQEQPVITWELSPPGLEDTYGFHLTNIGDRRARIETIRIGYNAEETAATAAEDLARLAFAQGEYFRFNPGPGFMMEPRERQYLYIFNKPLTGGQYDLFYQYVGKLAAEIYYCEVDLSSCWFKTVSLAQSGPAQKIAYSDIPPPAPVGRILGAF